MATADDCFARGVSASPYFGGLALSVNALTNVNHGEVLLVFVPDAADLLCTNEAYLQLLDRWGERRYIQPQWGTSRALQSSQQPDEFAAFAHGIFLTN